MSEERKVITLDKSNPIKYKSDLEVLERSYIGNGDMELANMVAMAAGVTRWTPEFGGMSFSPYREPIGTVFQNEGGKVDMPERPETKRDRQRAKKRKLKNKKSI